MRLEETQKNTHHQKYEVQSLKVFFNSLENVEYDYSSLSETMEIGLILAICAFIVILFDILFRCYKRLNYIKMDQQASALKIGDGSTSHNIIH